MILSLNNLLIPSNISPAIRQFKHDRRFTMIDFVLSIFSTIFQMDMRDHHDIPFAMPLMMGAFFTGILGFIIVRFIGNEQKEEINEPDV